MKILLTNLSLMYYTGTESWIYTMAKELMKEHDVTVYTKYDGLMGDRIRELGIEVITGNPGEYDFAIINHNIFWKEINCQKIFTSHSHFVDVEKPTVEMGDAWVGVNELICPRVIRNGIDLIRFKKTAINTKLKNILYLSNPAYSKGKEFIKEVFKNYNVITLDEQVFNIEEYIAKADLVITYARGAIEALVMGKNVIYGDWRNDSNCFMGYGMIIEDSYELFKTGSMRENIREMDKDTLLSELSQYDPFPALSERAREDYNVKNIAKQYVQYFNSNCSL